MKQAYHVKGRRVGGGWRAACPALLDHGAVTGGETREEAPVHIENVLMMVLEEMEKGGAPAPPDRAIPDGILLTFETG